MTDLDRREKDNRVAVELRMEFPRLYELAEQYERFGGSTDKLAAEADAALRELWMARTDACKISLPAVLNAIDLLRRLSEWDALAPPVQAPFGDAPFWKREIDAALEPFMEEQP